jgi:hypothetical protein
MGITKLVLGKSKLIQVILVAVALTGCASSGTRSVVPLADLDNYRVNCTVEKNVQIAFLQDQITMIDQDHNANGMLLFSTYGKMSAINDGTYYDRVKRQRGYHKVVALQKIDWLRNNCP